jgi:glycosyltransferase involved in cell wall biosynthesis
LNVFYPDAKKRDNLRKLWQLEDHHLLLLSVGSLIPLKNHESLIQAFAKLYPRYPFLRLKIVGQGPLKDSLEKKIQSLGLSKEIELTGVRSDIDSVMNAADLFVLPSLTESLGIVLLEAQACGCPALTSDVGGCTEVVPGPEHILTTLYDHKNQTSLFWDTRVLERWIELVHQGHDFCWDSFVKRWSLESTLQEWENLYKELRSSK